VRGKLAGLRLRRPAHLLKLDRRREELDLRLASRGRRHGSGDPRRHCLEPRPLSSSSTTPATTSSKSEAGAAADGPSSSQPFARIEVPHPVLALGKFNALHLGHKELLYQASRFGSPCLLTFSGMAAVLQWEPLPPLTAERDRARVYADWQADMHGGARPFEITVPFRQVRHLQPEDFVKVMVFEMGAKGMVCGENYRFGYRACGDADLLRELGQKHGATVKVVDLVTTTTEEGEEEEEQGAAAISSSKIRSLIAEGRLGGVSTMLGRKYRLLADVRGGGAAARDGDGGAVSLRKDSFLNMVPGPGTYRVGLPSTDAEAILRVGEGQETVALETGGGDEADLLLGDAAAEGLLAIDFL